MAPPVLEVDAGDIPIILRQTEKDARENPQYAWAYSLARAAAAIRFLQAELELAKSML